MTSYTYKTVPAPERARKIRGVKTPEDRFAATLEEDMNALGAEGWEFVRTECFTVEERTGLTGKKSVERRVMIYRKAVQEVTPEAEPVQLRPAEAPTPRPAPAEPEVTRGPRILGRPVPPVTRLKREASLRSEPD